MGVVTGAGVDLWLDVNDPRVVAEVGRDVDRRGHADRRVDGRGALGGAARPRAYVAMAAVVVVSPLRASDS